MRRLLCIGVFGTLLTNNAQSANFIFEHFDEPVGSGDTCRNSCGTSPRQNRHSRTSSTQSWNSMSFLWDVSGSLRVGEVSTVLVDVRSGEDRVIQSQSSTTIRDGDEGEDFVLQETLIFDSAPPVAYRQKNWIERGIKSKALLFLESKTISLRRPFSKRAWPKKSNLRLIFSCQICWLNTTRLHVVLQRDSSLVTRCSITRP